MSFKSQAPSLVSQSSANYLMPVSKDKFGRVSAASKYSAVQAVRQHGVSVAAVARHYGVARKTIYAWIKRVDARAQAGVYGVSALRAAYPAGAVHPQAKFHQFERHLLELVRQEPQLSVHALAARYAGELGISVWTIWSILDRNGLNRAAQRKQFAANSVQPLRETTEIGAAQRSGVIPKLVGLVRLWVASVPPPWQWATLRTGESVLTERYGVAKAIFSGLALGILCLFSGFFTFITQDGLRPQMQQVVHQQAGLEQVVSDVRDAADSGNDESFTAASEVTESGQVLGEAADIVLAGVVYEDDGQTPMGANKTVAIRINGSGSYSVETNSFGEWELTLTSEDVLVGDVVAVYLDDETEQAAAVAVASGSSIEDISLYQNELIVRNETGSNITQDHLYIGSDSDSDILYTVSTALGGDVTVISGVTLRVWNQRTFFAEGDLTTQGSGGIIVASGAVLKGDTGVSVTSAENLLIAAGGAFIAPESGTVVIGGSLAVDGSYSANLSTAHFVSTSQGESIESSQVLQLHHTVFNGSGGEWQLPADIKVSNLTITAGTVLAPAGSLIVTGSYVNNGTFTANDGTVVFSASTTGHTISGTLIGSSGFHNVVFAHPDGGWTFQNAADVSGEFSITAADSVLAPSGTLTVGGTFIGGSAFSANGGEVVLNGADGGAQRLHGNTQFYNLTATTTTGRKVEIAASDTISVGNNLSLTGASCEQLLEIGSTVPGSSYTITHTTEATNVLEYLLISDMSATNSLAVDDSVDAGGNSNVVIATGECGMHSSSSSATAASFQRKTFYDSTNDRDWALYHDGDNIVFEYSANDGVTWSQVGSLPYDTSDFSIWYQEVSSVAYVVLAVTDGTSIVLRRGTLGASSITWDTASPEVIAFVGSGGTDAYSHPYLSLDSSGYVWVTARHTQDSVYQFAAVRSSNTVAGTWTQAAFTFQESQYLTIADASSQVYGSVAPQQNQDMYAVFVVDAQLSGCIWDHSDATWENAAGAACLEEDLGDETDWLDQDWLYRKAVTIEGDEVAGSSNLSNYPLLISLDADSHLAAAAQADGDDLVFTAADGTTVLDHEIESFNSSTGALTAWVEVASVSYDQDTRLYIYYGNASIANQQHRNQTWSTNYQGVYHLSEDAAFPVTEILDTFNRSNGSLGTNWISPAVDGTALEINSNQVRSSSSGFSTGVWSQKIGNDQEAYFQVANKGTSGSYVSLYLRVNNPGGAGAGYYVELYTENSTEYLSFYRFDAAHNFTMLSDAEVSFSSGDWFGARIVGDTIIAYQSTNGSDWTVIGSQVDTTYPTGDYIGFEVYNTSARIDNFGGGGVSAFPEAGLLDNFNRSNGGLGENWENGIFGTNNLQISSNQLRSSTGNSVALWHEFMHPDQEAQFQVTTKPGNGQYVSFLLRFGETGGYSVDFNANSGTDTITFYRYDVSTDSWTGFGSTISQEFASGNRFGVRMIGSVIMVYRSTDGTNWTLLGGAFDDMHSLSGKAGIEISGTTARIDNFAAGPLTNPFTHQDASVFGRYGRNWEAQQVVGKIGSAQEFVAANSTDHISLRGSAWDGSGDGISLQAWVKFTSFSETNARIISRASATGSDSASNHSFMLGTTSSSGNMRLRSMFRIGSTVYTFTASSGNLSTGEWYHVAATYNGSVAKLYLNGAEVGSGSQSGTLSVVSNHVTWIGNQPGTQQRPLDGVVDEVRIVSAAMSADWIATEYANQSSPGSFYSLGSEQEYGVAGAATSNADTIDLISSAAAQQFSVVVDSSGAAHVVYIKDAATDYVAYKKTTANVWQTEATQLPSSASNDQAYPTISHDISNDVLYVFWTDISGSDRVILYRAYADASWASQVVWQESETHTHLTSTYSAAGRVAGFWTMGTSATYRVGWELVDQPSASTPLVTGIEINGGEDIVLTAGSATSISWTATATDLDGYENLDTANGRLFRSGVAGGRNCTADDKNCYVAATCSLESCSGNSCTVQCSADIEFFADPTDAGSPYSSQYWRAVVTVTDTTERTATELSWVGSPDLESLVAMDIAGSVTYGMLLPGEDTGSANAQTTITNQGNTTLDFEVSGDNMCSDYPTCSEEVITVGYQEFSQFGFVYGSGNVLSLSPITLSINLPPSNASPSTASNPLYWGIGIPNLKASGSYSGSNTVLAVDAY